MQEIFNFAKKNKQLSGPGNSGSVLSVGYDLKEKELGEIHKAASLGDLRQLAETNDVNERDEENRTALHIACALGHVEVVEFLVASGAKLDLCDNQKRTALMKAAQGQHDRCVRILLESNADPNLADIDGNTALHLAASIPSINTAQLLLEHGADTRAQNKEGHTPLIMSVLKNPEEMVDFHINEGASLNSMDQSQGSELMIAAVEGQIGVLQLLLQFDADVTLKDTKGWTADDHAVKGGNHPCSLLIIEHSAQMNDRPLSHEGPSKNEEIGALECRSLSGSDSESESDDSVQNIRSPQHPVDSSPSSFLSEGLQMDSNSLEDEDEEFFFDENDSSETSKGLYLEEGEDNSNSWDLDELELKQELAFSLRNQEQEMELLANSMKQFKKEHSETQRLLAQERSARMLQEKLLNSHVRKQLEMEEENKRRRNEVLSQLTEARDREGELARHNASLQEQVTVLKTDLEHSQANSSLEESNLLEENKALKEKLEAFDKEGYHLRTRLADLEASHREAVSSLSQKLSKEEARANSMEIEVQQANLQLTQKCLLFDVQQRDIDCAALRIKKLEAALQTKRGLVNLDLEAKQKQERLAQTQNEVTILRQQLKEAQSKCDENEERNRELASKAADLREQICRLEQEKKDRATSLKQLQQESADSHKKLSMNEAFLEVNTNYRSYLEEKKAQLFKEVESLKGKLEETEDQHAQAKRHINTLQSRLDERERELSSAAQKHQELLYASAELKKENADLRAQVEVEKQKAKKTAEQKKVAEVKLGEQVKKNTELHKEMHGLRTSLKIAKKDLQDRDEADEGAMIRHSEAEGALERMKKKAEDLQRKIDMEVSRCRQLEKENGDQVVTLKNLTQSNDQLERDKKQLEEALDLKRSTEAAEKIQMEEHCREVEESARQVIKQQLEQVDFFLQQHAAAQEELDQVKAANESNQRTQLEQKITKLEEELALVRTTHKDGLNQIDNVHRELQHYHQLYTQEMNLRKSLAAKLEEANSQLVECNAKLLNNHSHLAAPPLDVGALGASAQVPNPRTRAEQQGTIFPPYLADMQLRVNRILGVDATSRVEVNPEAKAGVSGEKPRNHEENA